MSSFYSVVYCLYFCLKSSMLIFNWWIEIAYSQILKNKNKNAVMISHECMFCEHATTAKTAFITVSSFWYLVAVSILITRCLSCHLWYMEVRVVSFSEHRFLSIQWNTANVSMQCIMWKQILVSVSSSMAYPDLGFRRGGGAFFCCVCV